MAMISDRFLLELRQARAIAILRTFRTEIAAEAMTAALRGGFKVIEFTLNTPGALELIREFSRYQNIIVGAGTVMSVQEVRLAAEAGANFIVSPVFDEVVVREALDHGLTVIPGCQTPTELWRAYRAGSQMQKLFPAPQDGPAYLRACLGPMPFLKIVPTSGVDESNVVPYLESGAYAVGFVNSLFRPEEVTAGRFDLIEARAVLLNAKAQEAMIR
jgi:2-dehydro-3-deoxyphosphogluconate aldolase/(4S)-4-hydroxy-2-oxoglutarate aldolase